MSKVWTVDELISAAQAFDSKAERDRLKKTVPETFHRGEYSSARRLAFTARKFARSKIAEKKAANRCEVHDVNLDNLPSGYNWCPYCEEQDRIEAERRHLMTRDRSLEPW